MVRSWLSWTGLNLTKNCLSYKEGRIVKKTVIVTGGAGYIGSTLVRLLLDRGYSVKVVDRFFFGKESLADVWDQIEPIKTDIRDVRQEVFEGVYAVMDLAALSNDPAGELDPQKTLDINYLGRVRVAHLAKRAGVKRYVLASSCSVYGFQDGWLDETSPVNPLTTYAEANILAERGVLPLADESFVVTALRQATVFGYSYRMRFDLVVNDMTGSLFTKGKVVMISDGEPWRPFVHVKDTARAFIEVIEADAKKVNGEVFNVGDNSLNIQIKDVAKAVGRVLGREGDIEIGGVPDHRSYKVKFDKINRVLGYKTQYSLEDGIMDVWNALKEGKTSYDDPKVRTVNWYRYLLESKKLVDEVAYRGEIL